MMNTKYLCAAVLLTLGACTAADDAGQLDSEQPLLKLSANVDLSATGRIRQTRADDGMYTNTTGFDGTESVKIYLNGKSDNYTVGTPDPDDDFKSPLTGGTLRCPSATTGTTPLYAVFPAAAAEAGTFTVAYDQTTDDAYKQSDLMYSTKSLDLSEKSQTQNLAFGHQMVKLKLKVTKGTDIATITRIEIKNAKRTMPFTVTSSELIQGTLATADDTYGDNVLMFSGTIDDDDPHTVVALFPAQAWEGTPFLEITADGQPICYTLERSDLLGGSEYLLSLTVEKGEDTIILDTAVILTEWTDDDIETK